MSPPVNIQPSLQKAQEVINSSVQSSKPANIVPLYASVPADLLTPSLAYLKVSAKSQSKLSFLFESAATTETIGRFSFVGIDPRKVLKTGPGHGPEADPLPLLEEELSQSRVATIPGLKLPPLTGGAIGYVGYDCVRYFEPKTARPMIDVLKVPESLFMFFDTIIAFDHFFQVVKVITYAKVPAILSDLPKAYAAASTTIIDLIHTLTSEDIPLPHQQPITQNQKYSCNKDREGYEGFVKHLKSHITCGDIIQAVPSRRLSRPTTLHPFNIYRHLRNVNPSPYLFYIDCSDFQLVGASPELLAKAEGGRIITHPIAGTVKRGQTSIEDELLANELRSSLKDRAEHVMLVDLARNDVNRVCDPLSTRVDRLMIVEKFSHVQHLVSQVSGVLREGMSRFDAFRSVFPAGTVSGAPKVRAMELIAELEKEKRGVYAGAVGYFGYGSVDAEGKKEEGAMDTCIALRTMLVKDGVAYLQAGGGIVFDSDPGEEFEETVNKLGANIKCIESAEEKYLAMESNGQTRNSGSNGTTMMEETQNEVTNGVKGAHIDLAAG
ncbi:MAG: hypothetical protein M1836_004747 [Candelina mexicana]|nr:MAG: hypothetical protein M1836_004747 [Candelina mexicana]